MMLRTRVLTAAVATVVAAAVVGCRADDSASTPTPTHATPTHATKASNAAFPTGDPPRIPYIVRDTLYLDDQPVAGTWWDVQTIRQITVATRGVQPFGRPVLFRNDRRTHLLEKAIGVARLSTTGTKLAWLERSGSSANLVVYDLVADRELGRLTVDPARMVTEDGTQETIRRLDDDGTVTHGGSLGIRTWKPGSAPVAATAGDREGFPVDLDEVSFGPDGSWGAWRTDRTGAATPTGSTHEFGAITVQAPYRPKGRFTIALPDGYGVRTLTWESATDVLLTYVDRPDSPWTPYLRCSVLDRHCEHAPTPADP